ncbi:helix-turn-helix transcriptional regulator [Candidatus Saccharibacteria bacterium]|nr:helix-turn-helix transcriptional regulator [Candidatus Saccharibacteria bacterium]
MKANLNDISAKEKSAEKQEFAGYVGKRLRKIRTEKGISQEQLSEKAGYYRTYVGHIENGQHSPSVHTMWRLSKVLKVDLGELLKGL